MFILKGFASHDQFNDNTRGVVSPIGEISTLSLTYARLRELYTHSSAEELSLHVFLSKLDGTQRKLTVPEVEHFTTVLKHIYDTTIAAAGPIFKDELLQDLIVTFATSANTFDCGEIIDTGTFSIPEWISWKNTSIPELGENVIKFWLVDQSFQNQYDEYEIVVLSPITNPDDFFRTGGEVDTMLKANSISDMLVKVQDLKGQYPETVVRAETYNYIDPANVNHVVPATWYLLIYGAYGNNVDAINDALVNHMLENSAYTREQWIQILPDLFRRTEFVILPLWNQYAIPNRTLEAGIYSSMINPNTAKAQVVAMLPDLDQAFVDQHMTLAFHPYKTLALAIMGSPENRDALYKLSDIFPDYLAVASTSIDFARMSQVTQDWASKLATMLVTAEEMTKYSTIPVGMMRVERDGVLYLVIRYGNIHYLVAAKAYTPAIG